MCQQRQLFCLQNGCMRVLLVVASQHASLVRKSRYICCEVLPGLMNVPMPAIAAQQSGLKQ